MAAAMLTENAIHKLNAGDVSVRPVLQVMDIRQIGNIQSTQERFRLVLSDGVFVQQAMLATQLNEAIKSGQLQKGSVIQLLEYICNTVQNRKIVIILNMEILMSIAALVGDAKTLASGSEEVSGGPGTGTGTGIGPGPGLGPGPGNLHQQRQLPPTNTGQMLPQPPQQSTYTPNGSNVGIRQASPVIGTVQSPGANQGHRPFMSTSTGGNSDSGGFNQQNTYGKPLPSYQPPPKYSMKGPIAKNEAPTRIVPIAALNPYQGRWTIKARVTAKGDLRRYHNARGDGKVFSFDLLDADSGEIRCTCFNATADQFYNTIDVGRVYLITKGSLKPAQKQFNHLKNDWEILLESASTIELCQDEDNSIPQQIFDFKPIGEIENMEKDSSVDIVGIVISIQDTQTIMKKNGTETMKRSLMLTDKSGRSVEFSMWGAFCSREGDQIQQQIQSGHFPVLVIKSGRVTEFSGKSLGTLNTSQLTINPDIPEAHALRGWHDSEGKHLIVQPISKDTGPGGRAETRKSVAQIKDEGLGRGEKADWITIRATISFIKADTFCYTACPLQFNEKKCSKKVTNNGDGTWHCERCEQSVPECDYRYLLQMQVQDHTGVSWISGFQEAGEEIFDVPARDLFMWKQHEDPRFGDTVQKVLFSTHTFKLKVKEEVFQDEARVKSTIVKAESVNFANEGKLLLDSIRQLERGEYGTKQPTAGYPPARDVPYGSGPTQGNSTYNSFSVNAQGIHSGTGGHGNSVGGTQHYGVSNSNKCYKCGKEGHYSNACPRGADDRNEMATGRGGPAVGVGTCFKCGQGGHYAKDCPNQGGYKNFGSGGGNYGGGGTFGSGGGNYGGSGNFGSGGGDFGNSGYGRRAS